MTADNIYTASNLFSLEPLQKVYETQNEGCDGLVFCQCSAQVTNG